MNDQLTSIPLDQLTDPWVLLRPVRRDTIDFLELKTSMDEKGLTNSISARPSTRKQGMHEIIDGMWRVTAARDLFWSHIPCIIKYNISDQRVLELQIEANAIRPQTKPTDFAKQIRRIQKNHEGITLGKLASLVNKNPMWIQKQLGLLRLDHPTQKAVDRGEIPLSNAYKLANIPPRLRPEYIDKAKTMSTKAFADLAQSVVKRFKEGVRQGKLDTFFINDFNAQPYLKSMKDILLEANSLAEAPMVLAVENCKTSLEVWEAALRWALHIDKRGVEQQEIAAKARARKSWKGE